MATARLIPDRPLAFIRDAVRRRRILWTHHMNMRLEHRSMSREAILAGVETYEIVEEYPADKYLPSYLVLARAQLESFHILFAVDVSGDNVRIVTAYRPASEEWLPDLKTRRTIP